MEFEGLDESALEAMAAKVAGYLEPGDAVVLSGEVGSGKTTFVRTAARSLDVEERVTSPTYQIARRYGGAAGGRAITVNHLDLYRLEALEDRDALELDDYLGPEAITFIEWASKDALDLIDEPTVVLISHQTPTTRRLSLRGPVARRMSGC